MTWRCSRQSRHLTRRPERLHQTSRVIAVTSHDLLASRVTPRTRISMASGDVSCLLWTSIHEDRGAAGGLCTPSFILASADGQASRVRAAGITVFITTPILFFLRTNIHILPLAACVCYINNCGAVLLRLHLRRRVALNLFYIPLSKFLKICINFLNICMVPFQST